MGRETYKEQNNRLAKSILERTYYEPFRKGEKELEIFLLGKCSAQCEYCYLSKHSDELYPKELSSNYDLLLKNLKILMNWYVKNNFKCRISIFSAEWLDKNDFRDKVFDILDKAFENTTNYPLYILIPSNMQFIKDEKATASIQKYIDLFKEKYNIPICISASIDGKYCDNFRTPVEDSFYTNLFTFLENNKFYCHPMVSSSNIKYWIDNYTWFRETAPFNIGQRLMMLEVRDETWNNTNINEFLTFLEFVINYQFDNDFHKNKKEFLKYILCLPNTIIKNYPNYLNIGLGPCNDFVKNSNTINCNVANWSLNIRLGDFSLIPCHRQSYEELILGQYQLNENNEITDFQVKNIELMIAYNHLKHDCFPHCESCKYIGCCIGFCLGNSYENYKNPFIPVKEVCKLYKSKIKFLIYTYDQMGLFDYLDEIQDISLDFKKYLTDLILDTRMEMEQKIHESIE